MGCLKCSVDTVQGFVTDRCPREYRTQQAWVEGEPEESFGSGIKTSNRDTFAVVAYRCGICGRLEFYTTERGKDLEITVKKLGENKRWWLKRKQRLRNF